MRILDVMPWWILALGLAAMPIALIYEVLQSALAAEWARTAGMAGGLAAFLFFTALVTFISRGEVRRP